MAQRSDSNPPTKPRKNISRPFGSPDPLDQFPAFEECPDENDVDEDYVGTNDGYHYLPHRHWCLLGEIVHVENFTRLRLIVKDRVDEEFVVAFYPDNEETLRVADYRIGRTVAILYAERHAFLDGTEGVRQENAKLVSVINAPVAKVLDMYRNEQFRKRGNDLHFKGLNLQCIKCKKNLDKPIVCGGCRSFAYCGRECQKASWEDELHPHKKECRARAVVKKLHDRDWDTFDNYWEFPL